MGPPGHIALAFAAKPAVPRASLVEFSMPAVGVAIYLRARKRTVASIPPPPMG
ncbi:MAG: hypothetical protein P8X95_00105 [Anaerolineales bacterium]